MREKILMEIKRLAAANGGTPPGREKFARVTGIRGSEWLGKFWTKWSEAVIEAGFEPQKFIQRWDPDQVFPHLAEACRHFRAFPTKYQMMFYQKEHPAFPHSSSLDAHFGSKTAMVEGLRDWASQQQEYQDLLSILPPKSSDPRLAAEREGYVYLIKAGAYFKIGRGDELEKRVKQIRTALPDAAVLEHSIRTDDPPGIEAYWHRRFADKRANGEWFKLSAADVAAFKRRKYQ
jgi:hypothetical protein